MANATKIALANWTKMVVATGGVGDIGLGAVNGYPPIGETLGTNKSFHYVIRAVNNTPLEAGVGVMTDVITLRRDNVYAKMLNGVYSAGDGLTNLNIPVGAFLYTADTKEMLEDLQLELPLRDYGNVSGATGVDLRNSAIKLNLTANATLTFSEPPADGVKHAVTLYVTSNENAATSPSTGYNITLAGATFIYNGSSAPAFTTSHLSPNVLELVTVDGGATYVVNHVTRQASPKHLGDISASTLTLDIRHPFQVARLTGSGATLLIDDVSPDVAFGEAAHFTFVNAGSVVKTISFDTNLLSVSGSVIAQVTLPVGYKVDFDVRRNPLSASVAYEAKIGDVNYNQTASGLATSFNPSDSAPTAIILSNSNKTITRAPSGGAVYAGSRTFGGKNTGKHRVALRCDAILTSGSGGSSSSVVQIGLAAAGVNLSQTTGIGVAGGYQVLLYTSSSNAVLNNVYGFLVNFALNKVWPTVNGAVTSGNPTAGTGGIDIADDTVFFPAVFMKTASTGGNPGLFTLLNELEDPYAGTWVDFPNWTA